MLKLCLSATDNTFCLICSIYLDVCIAEEEEEGFMCYNDENMPVDEV